ncbi:MAG: hydrolase 2, exosortase A system-associated [Gammaproteobacteria bacterium]
MGMEPAFREVAGRRLFTLRFRPPGEALRRVLVLPPFAEEMNKSRRLLAESARVLAARGCDVLLADLSGTGDSAGDFGDADWAQWRDEVAALAAGFLDAPGPGTRTLLAVRTGALFLDLRGLVDDARVVAWQPVFEGERVLQQFMRLRVMAAKFAGREESLAALRAELDAGHAVEVAGYLLAPGLAHGLAAARLEPAALAPARQVTLLEIRGGSGEAPSPPFERFTASARAAGGTLETRVVAAEQFWASQEIAAPVAVTEATLAALLADRDE